MWVSVVSSQRTLVLIASRQLDKLYGRGIVKNKYKHLFISGVTMTVYINIQYME